MRLVLNNLLLIFTFIIFSCNNDDEKFNEVNNMETESEMLSVPNYFPSYKENPDNPLTKNGILLGKQLFNDPTLSKNNKVSCATCHLPKFSFSDGQALSSLGVTNVRLNRSSPTLVNMLWINNGLFWDGGATNLESQALAPLTEHNEMGQNLNILIEELNSIPEYQYLFYKAFNSEINTSNILKALAQYQRTLISANSKYDKIKRKEPNIKFTKQEEKGYNLFKKNCASCHPEPLFTDNSFHNNGLDSEFNDKSFQNLFKGRYRITNNPKDIGKYKTPTLRNILNSAPYMHDGRLKNITEVLEHYCCNLKNSKTLDPLLIVNNNIGLPLNNKDRQNIIEFLKTLTDKDFISQ